MKRTLAGLTFIAVVILGSTWAGFKATSHLNKTQAVITTPTQETPTPLVVDAEMKDFVSGIMTRCRADLSPARAEILRDQITRIAVKRIEGKEAQQAFIFILCIESKYNQAAKSPVGAVGMAQLMPKYAPDFAKHCGLGELRPDDINDSEINLHLGACFFNSLVKETGNVYLAAAAYNSGLASSSVKNLKALGAPVPETAAYVAKVAYLKADSEKK